ncbi:hypothetical protein AsAng_0029070 [Aureispira anguillae]|uniref:Uncharacterized protein n=1 Tax=Aureispira anguillae TaxID=2864201 RepID=A0A916DTY0_9BACT|nr:hypothetical protein AsAng_0029070 [Aureispira anguillae]
MCGLKKWSKVFMLYNIFPLKVQRCKLNTKKATNFLSYKYLTKGIVFRLEQ